MSFRDREGTNENKSIKIVLRSCRSKCVFSKMCDFRICFIMEINPTIVKIQLKQTDGTSLFYLPDMSVNVMLAIISGKNVNSFLLFHKWAVKLPFLNQSQEHIGYGDAFCLTFLWCSLWLCRWTTSSSIMMADGHDDGSATIGMPPPSPLSDTH